MKPKKPRVTKAPVNKPSPIKIPNDFFGQPTATDTTSITTTPTKNAILKDLSLLNAFSSSSSSSHQSPSNHSGNDLASYLSPSNPNGKTHEEHFDDAGFLSPSLQDDVDENQLNELININNVGHDLMMHKNEFDDLEERDSDSFMSGSHHFDSENHNSHQHPTTIHEMYNQLIRSHNNIQSFDETSFLNRNGKLLDKLAHNKHLLVPDDDENEERDENETSFSKMGQANIGDHERDENNHVSSLNLDPSAFLP